MRASIVNLLSQNYDYFHFLRENATWHRQLNRHPKKVNEFINAYKIGRRKRFVDRLDDFQMLANILNNMPPSN